MLPIKSFGKNPKISLFWNIASRDSENSAPIQRAQPDADQHIGAAYDPSACVRQPQQFIPRAAVAKSGVDHPGRELFI